MYGRRGWRANQCTAFLVLARPSLRVLVSEDNRVNQILATRLLEKEGHRSVLASRRQRAVHLHGLGRREEALTEIDAVISLETAHHPPDDPGLAASRQVRARIVGGG